MRMPQAAARGVLTCFGGWLQPKEVRGTLVASYQVRFPDAELYPNLIERYSLVIQLAVAHHHRNPRCQPDQLRHADYRGGLGFLANRYRTRHLLLLASWNRYFVRSRKVCQFSMNRALSSHLLTSDASTARDGSLVEENGKRHTSRLRVSVAPKITSRTSTFCRICRK